MLNEVPDRILSPSKNVIHYQDVRQVKRILGIPIIVPSYLPPNLVPTPGAIESTGEPEFKVVLRYKFRTHDAYALIIE
jgi:hypothetical protein